MELAEKTVILNILLDVFKQLLHDGSKEFAQNDGDFSNYVISDENEVIPVTPLLSPNRLVCL